MVVGSYVRGTVVFPYGLGTIRHIKHHLTIHSGEKGLFYFVPEFVNLY